LKKFDNARWEWVTLLLVIACYSVWLLSTASFQFMVTSFGIVSAGLMLFLVTAIVTAFHTSIQHEVVHDHPTPYPLFNEALIFPSLILVYPFRRYRELHLTHHIDENLTDPYDDPESYFWPMCDKNKMGQIMKVLLAANNTFVGRMILGPPLGLLGFYRTELYRLVANEKGVRKAWVLHLVGCAGVYIWVTQICGIPFWAYVLFVSYPAVAWILIRSFAEHQSSNSIGGRTVIVEAHSFFGMLFLNNNLHMVHHAHPRVAWYNLPKLYRERKEQYLSANGNYLFNGYWQIISQFSFRRKQPVFHPILRQDIGKDAIKIPVT
jgi:fatty acid desaturase